MNGDIQTGFGSHESCVALGELDHGQPIFLPAGCERKDKIVEIVVEKVELSSYKAAFVAKGEVHAVARFRFEPRITDFKRQCACVRSKIIELFQSRRAIRVRVVHHERTVLPRIGVKTRRY